jgi:YegS/Rv2252/BmrU family lipid kinase
MSPDMDIPFRRAVLIENPASGMVSPRRKSAVRKALQTLRSAGVEVEHELINGHGSGAVIAARAVRDGCDAVLVCGGDGTIHQVLQPLVGTNVALGILPMGTANALASDLGLPRSPEKALRTLLTARAVGVPVGRIHYRDEAGQPQSHYFTVAAGIGADALLMARMDPVLKRRLGYLLYIIEAFRIWMGHSFPMFRLSFTSADGTKRVIEASQLLAVRVRSFGGVLGKLAPGASLHGHNLCMVAFRTRSRLRYLRFLLAVMAKRHTFGNEVELIEAGAVDCCACAADEPVYVEADGDLLGTVPARLEVADETLTLLIPPHAEP